MTDNDIDAAIDRAVRDMMRVRAPEQMRARILAGLERSGPRVFTPPRIAFAGAGALLLAFVLIQFAWPDGKQPALPSGVVTVPALGSVDGLAGVVPGSPQVPPGVPASQPRLVSAAAAPPLVEMPDTIPALEDLDPLVVPAPRVADIEPAGVTIAPLATIPDVVVEPLPFPPGSRD
jgi:hypothetical protein